MTTCQQWQLFWGPNLTLYYVYKWPLNNDHLSETATLFWPEGGRCTQVWLYIRLELRESQFLTGPLNQRSMIVPGADAIKKFTPSLGIPYLGVQTPR